MCIEGTRYIASTPLDTARPAPAATFPVALLTRGLRPARTGAGPAGSASALPAGTARAAPTAIRLIHPARPTPASLHVFLLDRPLDNDAALQHDLNRGFRHIDRNDPSLASRRINECANRWHRLFGLDVVIVFIGQAAQEATAHTRNLGGVQRQILLLRHLDRDDSKICNPRTTAERFAAWP